MFNSHMRSYAMVGDKVMWWPECVQPLPSTSTTRKTALGSPVKFAFLVTRDDVVSKRLKFGSAFLSYFSSESKLVLFF